MRVRETAIPGVVEILAAPAEDHRGAFLRTWCRESFAAAGIDFVPIQISLSENTARHTLRGMHWQAAAAEEQKLIRCVRGAVHDVAIALRPGSATRLRSGPIGSPSPRGPPRCRTRTLCPRPFATPARRPRRWPAAF